MRFYLLRFVTLMVVSVVYFSAVMATNAQVTLELGSSPAEIKRALISGGYSDVVIIKESLGATTVEGCLSGVRYRMKVLFTGRTKWHNKVGKCQSEITVEQARDILEQQGYDRVDIETRRNSYLAIACLNGERLRVSVGLYGKVRQQRRLGRCRSNNLSPTDVKADLRKQGYTRIRFTDRQLPRYVAEACRGLTQVELTIASDGDVRQELEIGRCRQAINPRNLVKIMQQAGFKQVKVIDDQLPQYVVEACRKGRKQEITLNRFGRIIDQYNIGKCARPLNGTQILQMVRAQKFSRVKLLSQNNGIYIVGLCSGPTRLDVTYDVYGTIIRKKIKGNCASNKVLDLYNRFTKQKVAGVRFFAEGCQNGNKIKIEFTSVGDIVGQEILGSCN